ncbi:putative receptor-like protein kinase, partial [Vitis vinifera]
LFIFLHYLTIPIAGYTPTENFAINCGSPGNSLEFGRRWTGDIDSKFSPLEKGKLSTTSPAAEQPLLLVPYSTARLSRNEFTYSFPLTAGQKYIRLHFYPSSYGEFNRSKAFFSVKTSGGYTLLSNFSAALAADLGKENIVKEFCINFHEVGEKLNITFTPTAGANAYALLTELKLSPCLTISTTLLQKRKRLGFKLLDNRIHLMLWKWYTD